MLLAVSAIVVELLSAYFGVLLAFLFDPAIEAPMSSSSDMQQEVLACSEVKPQRELLGASRWSLFGKLYGGH